jgi:O-antigen ligase
MLTAFKHLLRLAIIPVLYVGTIFTLLVTIFKDAKWGLLLMAMLIPMPNMWYKLQSYPYGKDIMDLLFFAVLLGIIIQKKGFAKTDNSWMIIVFIVMNYASLWNSSMRFSLSIPLTTSNELLIDWKNYIQMILLYFLVLNVMKEEEQQKVLVVLMTLVVLFIAIRCYRNFSGGAVFSYEKRVGGPFEAVGLGPNHLAAFIVYTSAMFLGLYLFDNDKKRKWLYLVTVLFSLHPLFFSYSRGGYLAAMGVVAFYAILKKRSLLIVIIAILFLWQTVLPTSVVDRIMMTETESGELEGSAAHRLNLWEHAYDLFKENPVFGVGFGGFAYSVPEGELTDVHNFYMKTLSEQGVIGLFFLLLMLFMAMRSGWLLFKKGEGMPFYQGLGFGFTGCIIAYAIKNLTGDSWSYFAVNGYFWIFWGLVDRGILIVQERKNILHHEKQKSTSPAF